MSSTGIELRGTVLAYIPTSARHWGLVDQRPVGTGDNNRGLSRLEEILEPFEGRRVSVRIMVEELPE